MLAEFRLLRRFWRKLFIKHACGESQLLGAGSSPRVREFG
jgi:hypothetical protein